LSPSPFGPPPISTKVGSQSRAENIWVNKVPGLMVPGQRMTAVAALIGSRGSLRADPRLTVDSHF
jgi:hypothetical protein